MMRNTITAKIGYRMKKSKTNENLRAVYDGDILLFVGELRSMEDYIDECKNGNNECAIKYEVFTTIYGNQFIYWGDIETGEDFITKVVA